jgi:hypothetical protein
VLDKIRAALPDSDDLQYNRYDPEADTSLELLYLTSVCDTAKIKELLVGPLLQASLPEQRERVLEALNPVQAENAPEAVKLLIDGSVCLKVDHKTFMVPMEKVESRSVPSVWLEPALQGSRDALSENIQMNLSLIRHRYRQPGLMIRHMVTGSKSQTKTVLLYDKELVSQDDLKNLTAKLEKVEIEVLLSQGTLMRKMSSNPFRIFPLLLLTERPDRVVENIARGRMVIMSETSPLAAIGPCRFFDFFASMDDTTHYPIMGLFLVQLRFLAFLITTITPGLYVALTAYSPQIFQLQLTLSIAGSRYAIPLPAFMEVCFMLLLTELLLEASVRLPKVIGPTATTVGGLILGQAVTEAGLVSNIMIIIVSAVAISNFVIPIHSMFFSIRILKYIFLGTAILFGLPGIIVVFNSMFFLLAHNRSLGQPYLQIYPEKWGAQGGRNH